MTHLRKIMLEELQRRNYADSTIRHYLRWVEDFARFFAKPPDRLGLEHVRTYQAYLLKTRKLDPGTVENHVAALRFFYVRTLKRPEFREFIPYPRVPKRLPGILSKEEVAGMINASGNLFRRTLLMVLYGNRDYLRMEGRFGFRQNLSCCNGWRRSICPRSQSAPAADSTDCYRRRKPADGVRFYRRRSECDWRRW